MRALLDANLLISYLLSPATASATIQVVEAGLIGAYTLLLTGGVVAELRDKTATKPYLVAHISPDQTARLVALLETVAEVIPELEESFPEVGWDRKDDYLFAHAVIGRVDYLVSGDKGVLKVQRVGNVQILSPAAFLHVLKDGGFI